MSKLRIALVTTFYPPHNFGGDGLYVRRFAHALARRGCDVHVLYDAYAYKTLAPKPLGNLSPLEEPEGFTVCALSSVLGPLSSLLTYSFGAPVAQGAAIDRFFDRGFDVTHFHNISLVGGPRILSKGSGVKLYTAHEHWLVCPTHILWRHNRELCDARECARCQIAYKRPPQPWRYTGLIEGEARNVDAFIALSRSTADNHRRFGFPFEMQVLPSFIPDEAGAGPTHDIALADRLQAYIRQHNVPKSAYEFTMLYGIQRQQQARLAKEGERLRVLISYSEHWFPWYMRRLAERPANVWFVIRTMFG